jgi:hypothetical protein
MRITDSLKKRDRIIGRVDDAFGCAVSFKLTSRQLTERLIAAEQSEGRVPAWVSAYVNGYVRAKTDALARTMIYGAWLDHSFYDATNRESPCYVENRGITWQKFGEITDKNPDSMVGHWWPSDVTRPWFVDTTNQTA